MIRNRNTSRNGSRFNEATIEAVWQKARIVPGKHSGIIRKDSCGAFIRRDEYGKTTPLGWEIDHIYPVSHGGSDLLSNLQPLQWQNNRKKSDSIAGWTCEVTAV